ncbi:MAG TPA: hypothetical protein VKV57_01065 [bacterium]|nr:hypothetical protein [bacterium]
MLTIGDLGRIAHLAGVRMTQVDLERLLPLVDALYVDLDRLTALPIADLEPAFTPKPWGEMTPGSRPR